MRIGSHSEQAAAIARHRAKYTFPLFARLPSRAHDKWKLRQLELHQSAFFNRSEYSDGELAHIRTTVNSFNRRYRVQFQMFNHETFLEVARIS